MSGEDNGSEPRELRSFGRRRGRKPSPRQQRLLEDLLPRFEIDPARPASMASLAAPGNEVWLEIGFGGGEHLVWQATHHPAVTLLGCEPFEDGVVKVLSEIEQRSIGNIRIFPDDVRPLLRALPRASIGRVFVLFPDPWPKRKHVKRRLVSAALLDLLAVVMRPGAELRLATDIGDYARTMLMALIAHKAFVWTAERPGDWRQRPADWPQTRYEQKALREGRRGYFLRFVRS